MSTYKTISIDIDPAEWAAFAEWAKDRHTTRTKVVRDLVHAAATSTLELPAINPYALIRQGVRLAAEGLRKLDAAEDRDLASDAVSAVDPTSVEWLE